MLSNHHVQTFRPYFFSVVWKIAGSAPDGGGGLCRDTFGTVVNPAMHGAGRYRHRLRIRDYSFQNLLKLTNFTKFLKFDKFVKIR